MNPGMQVGEIEAARDEFQRGFSDKTIRQQFVRKIFATVSLQLAFTSLVILIFISNESVKLFCLRNPFLFYVPSFGALAILIGLTCAQELRKTFPQNLIALCLFTLMESLAVAFITVFYQVEIVLYAFLTTAITTALLSIFASNTKFDATRCLSMLLLLLIVQIVMGFILIFVQFLSGRYYPFMHLILAFFGSFIFMLYFVAEVQMIIGGRSVEISPEDHILGALSIYISIINLFITFLQIIGICSNSDL